MSDLRTAAQQALKVLEAWDDLPSYQKPTVLYPQMDALKAALAQQAEPVEPVAKVELMMTGGNAGLATRIVEIENHLRERLRPGQQLYIAPPPPQRKLLTEEEILAAIGWERAEMYMKLTPNFPVDEAKQETLKNARAVERAVWEKNHG